MKIKQAIVMAIIGFSLIILLNIFGLIKEWSILKDLDGSAKSIIIDSLPTIPFALILIFFTYLYNQQKKNGTRNK